MSQRTEITEATIEELVRHFYARVQADRVLGPIFLNRIDDWDTHLNTMIDFWSSVMLKTGRFTGRPVQKHQALTGVSPEHFQTWLTHFSESAAKLFTPAIAAQFQVRAERIAMSLRRAMFTEKPILMESRA